ncbi:glycine cleavage T C-terminal barrel domain-containing protein, partial [Cupriavidus oxalaticus]
MVVVTVDGASDAMLWGGEAVLRTGPDGSVRAVGSLSSAAFGHTLGCPVGMALLAREDGPADAAWLEAGIYHVDLAGELLPARVHLRAPYDPASERPKG